MKMLEWIYFYFFSFELYGNDTKQKRVNYHFIFFIKNMKNMEKSWIPFTLKY